MIKAGEGWYVLDPTEWDDLIADEKLIEHLVDAMAYGQPRIIQISMIMVCIREWPDR